ESPRHAGDSTTSRLLGLGLALVFLVVLFVVLRDALLDGGLLVIVFLGDLLLRAGLLVVLVLFVGVGFLDALLEVLDPLAEPLSDVRDAACPEEQQRDQRDDEDFRGSDASHVRSYPV